MELRRTLDAGWLCCLVRHSVQEPAFFARAGANVGHGPLSHDFAQERVRLLALRDATGAGPCPAIRASQWTRACFAGPQYSADSLWAAGVQSLSESAHERHGARLQRCLRAPRRTRCEIRREGRADVRRNAEPGFQPG